MSRGWTWIDENADHDYDKLAPVLNALARQWSEVTTAEEQRRWQMQADREEGRDDLDFDSDEDAEAHRKLSAMAERMRLVMVDAQIDFLESELQSHGARMMRPYEHWNEDERLMEYLESER